MQYYMKAAQFSKDKSIEFLEVSMINEGNNFDINNSIYHTYNILEIEPALRDSFCPCSMHFYTFW